MKRGALLFWGSTLAAAALLVIWCGGGTREVARTKTAGDRTSPDAADQLTTIGAPQREAVGRTTTAGEAVHFTGKVVDLDGAPVPEATVGVFAQPNDEVPPLAETRVDAQGAFFITASDWPEEVWTVAKAEGHIATWESQTKADLRAASEPFTLVLEPTTEIHGQVRDAITALPIAGASVTCRQEVETTDRSGDFRFAEVSLGNVALSARADGHAQRTVQRLLRRPAPARIDIELDPCRAISVQIVDGESGAPISGATIEDGSAFLATADAEGRLSLCFAEGTALSTVVQAQGHAALFWSWTVDAVPARSLRLPLARCGWLEGRVVDQSGQPCSGVTVAADVAPGSESDPRDAAQVGFGEIRPVPALPRRGPMPMAKPARAQTDAAGVFRLPVTPSPASLVIGATHPELDFAPRPGVTVPAGASVWIEIVGRRTTRIHGRLLHNGEPCSARAEWRPADGGPAVVVSGRGEYSLAVAAGPGQLVLCEEKSREVKARVELVVEDARSYEQDLDWVEALAEIRGGVVDAAGVPVAGAWVIAYPKDSQNGRAFEAWSAADGTYVLRVPVEGEFVVTVRSQIPAGVKHVAAGATRVDFVLEQRGKVRLRLVDAATDAPISAAPEASRFWWRAASGRDFYAAIGEIDVEGRCELDLPVGDVDIEVDLGAAGYARYLVQRLSVGSEVDPAPVTVPLQRGVDLVVHLRGKAVEARAHEVLLLREDQMAGVGAPPPWNASFEYGIDISTWIREPHLMGQLLNAQDGGEARMRALAPGRYTLRAFPDDLVFDPPAIDVAPPRKSVEIRCRPR